MSADSHDTVLRERTPRDMHGEQPTPPSDAERLSLLVLSDRHIATYPLPSAGEIAIGRSPKADILIDDPTMSRHHAVLAIGPPITIQDCGSANGTWVGGKRLERGRPVELATSEVVLVGSVTLILQRRAAPLRPRRLWTHDYFEVRVEEECARGRRKGTTFAVMRVRCKNLGAGQSAVGELARLSDVIGEYGPGDYEVLLVDSDPEAAEIAMRRFLSGFSERDLVVECGLACFPRDGSNPDELIAHAGQFGRAEPPSARTAPSEIISDHVMQELYRLASRVAAGNISVLILGETGAGKEVLAAHIHRSSPRAAKPYLKLNCAALSETLLESELFGHERGAFTGAVKDKAGLLETADAGTVFLDEVGELPLSIQVKLLRVLEERVVLRVGGLKPRQIDVRFIAATNRDLEAEIARGTFRQDLFYRLNGATLVIPPLRERPREIAALAEMFVVQAARQINLSPPPTLSREALDALEQYSWPGNIRELRNAIERAVLLCGGSAITPNHLPIEKMRVTFSTVRAAPPIAPPVVATAGPVDDRAELDRILAALQECSGNQTRAAKLLGMGRRTLITKLERYNITRPRKPR